MFTQDQVRRQIKSDRELIDPHLVVSRLYEYGGRSIVPPARTCARRSFPAYMGLIKQIDDQIGRLLDYLESANLYYPKP